MVGGEAGCEVSEDLRGFSSFAKVFRCFRVFLGVFKFFSAFVGGF